MKKIITIAAVCLLTELGTSWWTWVHAPTDSLRVVYDESFLAYERSRLVVWLVIMIVITLIWLVSRKMGHPEDGGRTERR